MDISLNNEVPIKRHNQKKEGFKAFSEPLEECFVNVEMKDEESEINEEQGISEQSAWMISTTCQNDPLDLNTFPNQKNEVEKEVELNTSDINYELNDPLNSTTVTSKTETNQKEGFEPNKNLTTFKIKEEPELCIVENEETINSCNVNKEKMKDISEDNEICFVNVKMEEKDLESENNEEEQQKVLWTDTKSLNETLDDDALPNQEIGDSQQGHEAVIIKRSLTNGQQKTIVSCVVCGKLFSRKSILIPHMRIHTGEKPFQCEVCEKFFISKYKRDRHMMIHTGEKPFNCEVCKKLFSRKSILITHMKIHTGVKPFKCKVCEKLFSRKNLLINHMRIHTGEKPFKCEVCEKLFRTKDILVVHMKIHTGEKPFKCSFCGNDFRRKDQLVAHMRNLGH